MTKALVMGGGGLVGLGWGIGWFDGLSKADGSLADADRVIGTSAGAALGPMLAGKDRSRIAQMLTLAPAIGGDGGSQPEALQLMVGAQDASVETIIKIGQAALVADTMTAERWIGVVGMLGAGLDWTPALEIVATDAATGERVVLKATDCALATACAASAAVPGLLPAVPVGERMLVDGGVASATNADLAAGSDRVLVLRLVPARADGAYGNRAERLECELAVVGGGALVIVPEELPAGGLMDAALVSPAYTAGYQQGKRDAPAVLAFWQS